MIIMYRRTIEYSKVSSSVQDHKIKIRLWSQHSDPETNNLKQRRELMMLKTSSDMKMVTKKSKPRSNMHQVMKTSLGLQTKLWRIKSTVNVVKNIWPILFSYEETSLSLRHQYVLSLWIRIRHVTKTHKTFVKDKVDTTNHSRRSKEILKYCST